jgi:NDP-sugar pyrophosphorylase family protein
MPKPLVPIGERPIIEILLGHLRRCGVTRAVMAVNHLAHLITALLGTGERYGLALEYSQEDKALGTVGPLKLIPDLPANFIVANGDVLTDLDVGALYNDHVASGAAVTIACSRREEQIDFGVLQADSAGRLVGFEEKPVQEFLVSAGVYVFSREVLETVPAGQPFGFDQLVAELLKAGKEVRVFNHDGYWLDIGRVADYEQAQQEIETIRNLGL